MAGIVWKRGAEDDLLRIFAGFEDFRAGSGETFTLKLDAVLQNLRSHPGLAPVFSTDDASHHLQRLFQHLMAIKSAFP